MKVSISRAAKELGVSITTLRRWEEAGKIVPERTANGHRRYDLAKLTGTVPRLERSEKLTICYARVSSHDQKQDLHRQIELLESFCSCNGWSYEIIKDLGSGMNCRKPGLCQLIKRICNGDVGRLVLTHKDRLLRFGADLVFSLCEIFGTEIVIINTSEESSFEDELVADVLEIITVFSARLYGSCSRKNKKLIDELREAASRV
jgi:predicted site-specific integrase-resolvase